LILPQTPKLSSLFRREQFTAEFAENAEDGIELKPPMDADERRKARRQKAEGFDRRLSAFICGFFSFLRVLCDLCGERFVNMSV